MPRDLRARAVVPLMLFGAACGRAAEPAGPPMLDAAPPPAPVAAPESASADLDALERDLSVSEERLNQYLALREDPRESAITLRDDSEGKKAEKPKGSATSAGPGHAQPPPAAAPRPARKRVEEERPADAAAAEAPASAPAAESVENACDLACRAFGSMQRSADRICSIAGEGDARCRRARERVADASARIASAPCTCRNVE